MKRSRARQKGSYLLEVLFAILVFAFGILGLVDLASKSVRATNDARYRAEAANLANAVIAEMWGTAAANLDASFGSGGTQLTAWQSQVASLLPYATGNNAPRIDLSQPGLSSQSRTVVVTVFWQAPGESTPHTYLISAQIGKNT